MDQEVTMMNLEQEAEKLNIEEEVKLVEIEDDDTPLSKLKNHLKDSIAETEAKPEQQTIENNNENTTQDEIKVLSVSQTEETINITPSKEETLIEPAENNFKIVTSEPNISTQEEVANDNPKEQIVSEDFWKNKEVFKKIELYQQEEQQKTEEKKAFELPSVLKTLREKSGTASSNKPWLMKKKKAVEIQNVETPKEETKPEVKALEEVLETPNLSEEIPAVNPEEITA